jgi:uncharacterized protein (UPF0210 family)
LALLFFVILGGIVVAQQLQIRTINYHIGTTEKQILETDEQVRVLNKKHEEAQNPARLWAKVKELGIPIVPPEYKEEPVKPGQKPKAEPGKSTADASRAKTDKNEKKKG